MMYILSYLYIKAAVENLSNFALTTAARLIIISLTI